MLLDRKAGRDENQLAGRSPDASGIGILMGLSRQQLAYGKTIDTASRRHAHLFAALPLNKLGSAGIGDAAP